MFRFKQFSIQDDAATMKVGTDAVLLGAWADVGEAKNILDIGTGCGVIALMMAQRSDLTAHIDAVEPDERSAQQASENFESSPWPGKIKLHNTTIQQYQQAPYDLIVSNPPFFSKSLLPPAATRQTSRHTETLSFDDLLTSVKRLLSDKGRFALILPVAEGNEFRESAQRYDLGCIRSMAFYSRKGKPQERWLMEFSFGGKISREETMTLYENGDQWADNYARLTGEFYLL